jgi:hypothetical protein
LQVNIISIVRHPAYVGSCELSRRVETEQECPPFDFSNPGNQGAFTRNDGCHLFSLTGNQGAFTRNDGCHMDVTWMSPFQPSRPRASASMVLLPVLAVPRAWLAAEVVSPKALSVAEDCEVGVPKKSVEVLELVGVL